MSAAPTARPRIRRAPTFLSSYARTLTNGSLRFHTDRTDVVGLLCVRQASERRRQHARLDARHPQRHSRPSALTCSTRCSLDYWRSRFGEEGTGKDGAKHHPSNGLPAADLRRPRRQVHLALFADLHRGRPDGARHSQAHGGAEGSDRCPDGDGAGTLLRDDAPSPATCRRSTAT